MEISSAELLAPAGDFDTARAAFAVGADAVYCGLADYSARAFAKNLTADELRRLVTLAHGLGRRVYVTFNTVIDEDALEDAIRTLAELDDIGPDALIVQDLGVARICRRHFPRLALHASTQLVAHNLEGVLALGELGFTRVVLAREVSLDDIAAIAKRCGSIELECFIHGALCYSVSGLCLFSAMERDRSGNRGKCAYCCRLPYSTPEGSRTLAFSMRDLRLGEDVRRLVDVGVKSLKIEGRMKTSLYVASVTRYYRQILDGTSSVRDAVTVADLETVFSRRTTKLYLDGPDSPSPIDANSLGHVGTRIGTLKRVTRDREGRAWLRFHTARALEKHDGLQFDSPDGGKPIGFGIFDMRRALSRSNVFEVEAGTDVEIAVPDDVAEVLRPGATVYCSMSNAVKRRFPMPAYRPGEWQGVRAVDLVVTLSADGISASASADGVTVTATHESSLSMAKRPEGTFAAVEKAFSRLGETAWRIGKVDLVDPDRLFAPMSVLNDLRRDIVERLDDAVARRRGERIAAACAELAAEPVLPSAITPKRTVRLRPDQPLPAGEWDEVVVVINPSADELGSCATRHDLRLALPVYNPEGAFNDLRRFVKRQMRRGFMRWEASDLATLRMLRALGVTDITADWTLYAFNSQSLATLRELGVTRVVASPENGGENLAYLAESGCAVSFLAQQSTPLFISLTRPVRTDLTEVRSFDLGGIWVTVKPTPRTFATPNGMPVRIDLSWDPR